MDLLQDIEEATRHKPGTVQIQLRRLADELGSTKGGDTMEVVDRIGMLTVGIALGLAFYMNIDKTKALPLFGTASKVARDTLKLNEHGRIIQRLRDNTPSH